MRHYYIYYIHTVKKPKHAGKIVKTTVFVEISKSDDSIEDVRRGFKIRYPELYIVKIIKEFRQK